MPCLLELKVNILPDRDDPPIKLECWFRKHPFATHHKPKRLVSMDLADTPSL